MRMEPARKPLPAVIPSSLHDDEEIIILGLPVGTKYTVTEELADGYDITAEVDQAGTVNNKCCKGTLVQI